jgi:hypothetical protein
MAVGTKRICGARLSPAEYAPTGLAYASRSCVQVERCRRNNDICDVHQPAVGVSNAIAIANAFVQRRARQPAVDSGNCDSVSPDRTTVRSLRYDNRDLCAWKLRL